MLNIKNRHLTHFFFGMKKYTRLLDKIREVKPRTSCQIQELEIKCMTKMNQSSKKYETIAGGKSQKRRVYPQSNSVGLRKMNQLLRGKSQSMTQIYKYTIINIH